MPGISERPHDLRVEKHDVPLSARVPGHAVSSDVAPMFVGEGAERRQDLTEIGFGLPQIVKVRRDGSDVRADASKAGPRQVRTNVIDHETANWVAR